MQKFFSTRMKFSKVIAVLGMVLACTLIQVDAANLVCGASAVTVTFQAADAMALEVLTGHALAVKTVRPVLSELGMISSHCKMVFYTSGTEFTLSFNQTECNPVITTVSNNVVYTWRMWKVVQSADFDTVARFENGYLEFKCEYPEIVTVAASFEPTIGVTDISTTAMGMFDFFMNLYADNMQTPISGDVIVPARLYGEITLNIGMLGTLTAQVKKCWATPTSDPAEVTRHGTYIFVDNFCGVKGSTTDPEGVAKVTQAGSNETAKYDFESFVFSAERENYTTIWIHCEARACDTMLDGAACAPQTLPCISPAKKKRDIADDDMYNTRIVSTGPIHVRPAAKTCDKNNGECAEICTMEEDRVVCSCPGGLRLGEDRRSCIGGVVVVADELPGVQSQTEDFFYLDATKVFVVAAMLILAVFAIAVAFLKCTRSKFDKSRVFQTA